MTALSPRFWRLYASSATSNLADGIGRTALPLLAAAYTRNPLLVSGLATFAFLPWLLFALPSGAIIDRVDRSHAMAVANGVRAVAMGTLAALVVSDSGSIIALYVIAFVLGACETIYDCATRAILPQVVAPQGLERANGLLTVEETLGQAFFGAPIGSALFAVTLAFPLFLNAGGFAAAALLVLTLPGAYRPVRDAATATSIRVDVVAGVRWLRRHSFLRGLTLVSTAACRAQNLGNGVLVLYVLETWQLPAGDFGFVLVAAGTGAVLGGLVATPLVRRHGRAAVIVGASFIDAAGVLGMGLTSNGYLGSAMFATAAFGTTAWNVVTMSLRQSLIPHELFGRVQGAYRTLVWGAIPVGSLAGGLAAHAFGLPAAFLLSGAGLFLVAFATVPLVAQAPGRPGRPRAIARARRVLTLRRAT